MAELTHHYSRKSQVSNKNNGSLRFSGQFSIDLGFISMYHWRFKAWFNQPHPTWDQPSKSIKFHASMRRVVPATPAVMAGTLMADKAGFSWLNGQAVGVFSV